MKTALSTRPMQLSRQLYLNPVRVVSVAAVLLTVISLAAPAQAKQPAADCCPPTAATYAPSYTVYGTRYYGSIDPYPIGYYPYASAYGTAGYAVGYYPYAQPVVAVPPPAYPYPYPSPYAFGYYGYRSGPWAYYGYPGWGWGGGTWGWGGGWPYGF